MRQLLLTILLLTTTTSLFARKNDSVTITGKVLSRDTTLLQLRSLLAEKMGKIITCVGPFAPDFTYSDVYLPSERGIIEIYKKERPKEVEIDSSSNAHNQAISHHRTDSHGEFSLRLQRGEKYFIKFYEPNLEMETVEMTIKTNKKSLRLKPIYLEVKREVEDI